MNCQVPGARYLLHQTGCESINVLRVESVCRLVEGQNSTVLAEGIGQCQPDDDGSKHLLTCRATTSHVHLNAVLDHYNLGGSVTTSGDG